MQRGQLESHIKFLTESHLNLACRELKVTQEKLKKIFEDAKYKVRHIYQRHEQGVGIRLKHFEEKLNTKQAKLDKQHQQLEQKLNTNQTELEKKHQQLEQKFNTNQINLIKQEQLEERVKTLEQEISMNRNRFWGMIFVLGVLFVKLFW